MSTSSLPFLAGTEYECGLFARAAQWPGYNRPGELTGEAVRELAIHEGLDFATALLYDRVRRWPRHAEFIQRMESFPAEDPVERSLNATVVILPGAFYK